MAIVVFAVLLGAIGLGTIIVALVQTRPVRTRLVGQTWFEVGLKLMPMLDEARAVDMAGSKLPAVFLDTDLLMIVLSRNEVLRLRILTDLYFDEELYKMFARRVEAHWSRAVVGDFMLVDGGRWLILAEQHFVDDEWRPSVVAYERPYFAGRRFEGHFDDLWTRQEAY